MSTRARKPTLLALLILLSMPSFAAPGNRYPMVLVHGFTGWGPGEMGNIHYWGGHDSLTAILSAAGYPAYEGVVGPLASNWDRACELYAYIKGGRVDYGAAHARRSVGREQRPDEQRRAEQQVAEFDEIVDQRLVMLSQPVM